jgi:hypothetical protein
LARRLAYAAEPAGAVKRARNARADRHVSLRPAPDTMSWFGAPLPVEDGVRCLAALTRHADQAKAAGDARSRGQIMADTTVERLTGQAAADGAPVELNLTMPIEHLLDPGGHHPGRPIRLGADPGRTRRRPPAPGRHPGGMASAVHRPRRPVRRPHSDRWRPHRPPVHRLARQAAQAARQRSLPRTLLRRRRSGTWTTSPPTETAARPPSPTDAACANGTTTAAKCPAGPSRL